MSEPSPTPDTAAPMVPDEAWQAAEDLYRVHGVAFDDFARTAISVAFSAALAAHSVAGTAAPAGALVEQTLDQMARLIAAVDGIVMDTDGDRERHQRMVDTFRAYELKARAALAGSGTAALTEDAYRDLLGAIWLYVDWRYVTKQLTTEQKELWADAVDNFGDPGDRGPKAERWWRPRMCTCGHDAARHLVLSVDPPPGCRECDCNWFLAAAQARDGDE